MAFSLRNFLNEHFFEHNEMPKKQFSISYYTGSVSMSDWAKLPKPEKEKALKKRWFLYYRFRNPLTGKMERQDNIYAPLEFTKTERIKYLRNFDLALREAIEKGFDPFNDEYKKFFIKNEQIILDKALDFALEQKKLIVNERTYSGYDLKVRALKKYLEKYQLFYLNSTDFNRKMANGFLNEVLKTTSPRNRNNYRGELSAIFSTLLENEMVEHNYFKEIPNLSTKPVNNKPFTEDEVLKISKHLKESDPYLLLYIKFVSYNFLRPNEVSKLKRKHFDFNSNTIHLLTKTGYKTKIIPEILLKELDSIKEINPDYFIFTPNGEPGEWNTSEHQRRNYFSKQFNKKVKKKFGFTKEYGIYSFRHTFITILVKSIMGKGYTLEEALHRAMPITGHTSIDGIRNYIRNINAVLPEDYSDLFGIKI